jgi:GDPmannose 4,6-dehydratase
MTRKKALISGITGQDGAYLAELLLEKGYEVHGLQRRSSVDNTIRLSHLDVKLHHGDLTDGGSLFQLVNALQPDEIYNLAAQSDVAISFESPDTLLPSLNFGIIWSCTRGSSTRDNSLPSQISLCDF